MDIVSLIYPRTCFGCGRWGAYVCAYCLNTLRLEKELKCFMCEKPSLQGMTHFKCKNSLAIDGVLSVFVYQGIIREMISSLKYGFVTDLVSTLVDLLVSYGDFSSINTKDLLVVPMPLHKSRYRWRGFNQSSLLAKNIAKYCGWCYCDEILVRHRNTKVQMSLSQEKRHSNVDGAFKIEKDISLKGVSVLLIDDVVTTGSTLKAAVKTLKRAGAATVYGLVLSS